MENSVARFPNDPPARDGTGSRPRTAASRPTRAGEALTSAALALSLGMIAWVFAGAHAKVEPPRRRPLAEGGVEHRSPARLGAVRLGEFRNGPVEVEIRRIEAADHALGARRTGQEIDGRL